MKTKYLPILLLLTLATLTGRAQVRSIQVHQNGERTYAVPATGDNDIRFMTPPSLRA